MSFTDVRRGTVMDMMTRLDIMVCTYVGCGVRWSWPRPVTRTARNSHDKVIQLSLANVYKLVFWYKK
jgi:hypothetical protein